MPLRPVCHLGPSHTRRLMLTSMKTTQAGRKVWLLLYASLSFLLLAVQAEVTAPSRSENIPRDLLVNGVDTALGQYPYHVRVGCCSGALIAPDVVLSVGHVLPPPDAVSSMKLYVGAYATDTDGTKDHAQGFGVKQAWLHPNYTSVHYDFSIFLLDGLAKDVEPILLNGQNSVPEPGSDVTMLGMGTFNLSTSVRPAVLQSVVTQTISNNECRQAYDPERGISYGGDFIGPTNFCTFSDRDGCVFDSGGPIVYQDDNDDEVLVGLISFGVDCADTVYPAVNARVSAVYDWIQSIVCAHSKDPPPSFLCESASKFQLSATTSASFVSVENGYTTFGFSKIVSLIGVVMMTGVFFLGFLFRIKSRQGYEQISGTTEER